MADYDVIVIGAGNGGISCAALLAKQGRKVLVLEQSDRVGGCCSTFVKDGYHFDVGASIVEVIYPIELAFKMLGTEFQKEVELIPCDPIYSYIFRDGSRVNYPLSLEGTAEVIGKLNEADGKQWYKLADYFAEMMKQTIEAFFTSPANNMVDMLKMVAKNPGILKFLPLFATSYQDVIKKYFKKYGKEYKTTVYGQSCVKEVDITGMEEIHKHLVAVDSFLTLENGEVQRIFVTLKKGPWGWRFVSWELASR